MSHVRQQIREAVATRLTGLTTTGVNVFASRVYSLADEKLPALAVYTRSESSDAANLARDLNRQLSIVIEGYAKGATSLGDTLDTVAAEVEAAMATDSNLNGLGKLSVLKGTEIDFQREEAEKPIGVIRMMYNVFYQTSAADAETAL